jgi:hypothetical protein
MLKIQTITLPVGPLAHANATVHIRFLVTVKIRTNTQRLPES